MFQLSGFYYNVKLGLLRYDSYCRVEALYPRNTHDMLKALAGLPLQ